ncbi:MAG TPA: hypothetical protein VGR21_05985, partial [Cryptosporangiaceae bacterium]|nr:hypothetical protein [Cryptosporangiaceae bacterium]
MRTLVRYTKQSADLADRKTGLCGLASHLSGPLGGSGLCLFCDLPPGTQVRDLFGKPWYVDFHPERI